MNSSSTNLQSQIHVNFCEIVPERLWHSCQKPPSPSSKVIILIHPVMTDGRLAQFENDGTFSQVCVIQQRYFHLGNMESLLCKNGFLFKWTMQRWQILWLTTAWVTGNCSHTSISKKERRASHHSKYTSAEQRRIDKHLIFHHSSKTKSIIQVIILPFLKGSCHYILISGLWLYFLFSCLSKSY